MVTRDPARVLVADGHSDSADMIAAVLSANGFQSRVAYGGRRAIDLATIWRPDGALIDLGMPDMPGHDVARHLRALYGEKIRLLAYTARTAAGDRALAIHAGFDHVVPKPADPIELARALREQLATTLSRSVDLRCEQVRMRIELTRTLLARAEAARRHDDRRRVVLFAERAIGLLAKDAARLPLDDDERASIDRQIESLAERLMKLERR